MQNYFLEIWKKQQANSAIRELQMKLFTISKQTGKASWFGWVEYFSIIVSKDYARTTLLVAQH
jgi:hypothetical protein